MNLPAKLKFVALCAYNCSVLIILIILVGAYFVDVYKLYLKLQTLQPRKLMDEVVFAIY